MSGEARRSKLGEILVENGAITVAQLEHALAEQASLKLPIGQVLVKLDYVTDETMRQALGLQLNVPYLDLENVMIDRSLARVINPTFARRHALLPVATVGRTLTVAMDDPTATAVVQDLSRLTGFSVTLVTSSSRAIQRAFRRLYDDVPEGLVGARADHGDRLPAHAQIVGVIEELDSIVGRQSEAALSELLAHALTEGASTVHLYVTVAGTEVWLRRPGGLERLAAGPLQDRLDQHAREVPSMIRRLADMDNDAVQPGTGHAELTVQAGGRSLLVELDLSMLPCAGGDSIVIRLIDPTAEPRSLEALGYTTALISQIDAVLERPSGMVLVADSSPATAETLHACLKRIARPSARIVTVEDPITFANRAARQCEAGAAPDRSIASHLRVVVRHDADVLLVSDLADRETAALAFRHAQSGRLVLAAVAASASAADVIAALVDLGVPASTIGQSLTAVICPRTAQGGASLVASADVWVPDQQDADVIAERAPWSVLRQSARRNTVTG